MRYANIAGFTPAYGDATSGGDADLDRWLSARTAQLVRHASDGYERWLTVDVIRAFETFLDDMSNWYVRRSRRRFWDGDEAALRTLWSSVVTALRVVSPVLPFLTEHLWQRLVVAADPHAPSSIFLAGWPAQEPVDDELLADMAAVRKVVELGRQARAASKLRVRQPLHRLVVDGADRVAPYVAEIADELRVKAVALGRIDATDIRVRPNLPVLGPRLGAQVGPLRQALAAGQFELQPDGGVRAAGLQLTADEVLVERTEKPGWGIATSDGTTVALDTTLDDDLLVEGRVFDLIHAVNTRRKEAGLSITDRIRLWLAPADADLLAHRE